MATVIVTLRVMPESVDTKLSDIETSVKEIIERMGGDWGRATQEPIAFGLKALDVVFLWEESKGSTEELEKAVQALEQVLSAEVRDVRRAIG